MRLRPFIVWTASIQIFLTFAATIFGWSGREFLLSLIGASLITMANFFALTYLWYRITFGKKNLALPLLLIVSKYGILVWILSCAPDLHWVSVSGVAFGVVLHPIALVVGGFVSQRALEGRASRSS